MNAVCLTKKGSNRNEMSSGSEVQKDGNLSISLFESHQKFLEMLTIISFASSRMLYRGRQERDYYVFYADKICQ